MRPYVCAIMIALWPAWAFAQTTTFFCEFDDTQTMVVCIKAGSTAPVFQYNLPKLSIPLLPTLASSSNTDAPIKLIRERCRWRVEDFRAQELEASFNNSLEGLRLRAESLREASEDNLTLYKQIILLYSGLLERYQTGLKAYRNAIKSCRTTPYVVYPHRL
jgi:hypothetical protein